MLLHKSHLFAGYLNALDLTGGWAPLYLFGHGWLHELRASAGISWHAAKLFGANWLLRGEVHAFAAWDPAAAALQPPGFGAALLVEPF
jgi:hypothetical protein